LQIVKVHLGLVEDPPGPRAFRRQQTAAMLEPARGAPGHRAEDVEIAE
jgi:hypothetical protein